MAIKRLILVLQSSDKDFWKALSEIYINEPIIPDFVAKFRTFWGRVPDPLPFRTFQDLQDPVGALHDRATQLNWLLGDEIKTEKNKQIK